jgi:hypothetical protein
LLDIGIKADAASIGIQQLSPVLERSGTGLSSIIPVKGWFRHWYFYPFRYRNYPVPQFNI